MALWIGVNIWSADDMLPAGTKPLPVIVFTYHQ